MQKKINDIPVSDGVFNEMLLLQERTRRIDAEVKLLQREKADTDLAIANLMASIEKDHPDKALNEQVAAGSNVQTS